MANDKSFEDILGFTLEYEGGYSNNPNDPGGATNKGITQHTYNDYNQTHNLPITDVKNITDQEVYAIYYANYWSQPELYMLPDKVAMAVFDWGVNSGPHKAVVALQSIVSADTDGILGPKTIEAVKAFISTNSEDVLLHEYLAYRSNFYVHLSAIGNNHVFLKGWLNRVNALKEFLHAD